MLIVVDLAGIRSSQRSRPARSWAIRSLRTGRSSGAQRCRSPAASPSESWVSRPSDAFREVCLMCVCVSQGSSESPHSSAGQHPRSRPGEMLGLRPVLRRDQRYLTPHRGLCVQPAAGHASPHLHTHIQHVSTRATHTHTTLDHTLQWCTLYKVLCFHF